MHHTMAHSSNIPRARHRATMLVMSLMLLAPAWCVAQDLDGDGWAPSDGDCCDVASASCPHPIYVNPGALEIVGNLVDDDCDVATSDDTPPPACSGTLDFTVTPQQIAEAMDLCLATTQNPPLPLRRWGLISASFLLADGATPNATSLGQMQNSQAAVLNSYGTGGIGSVRGTTMAGLSNGWMRDQNDPGYAGTSSTFGRSGNPPAAFLAAHGGSLPTGNLCGTSCPGGTGANDSVNTRLTLRAPTNVVALSYRFRHFTGDYPTYLCSAYNDLHLALLNSSHPALPADRNIAANADGSRCSSGNTAYSLCTAGQATNYPCVTCDAGATALAGTGIAAGTDWSLARGPVVPGETLTLDLMVFDVGDNIIDMNVLLDDFQWLPEIVFGGPLTAGFE